MKTEIDKFLKKYKANQQLVLKASERVINSTLHEMYKRIIDRTPVGNPSLWKYPAPKDYNPGTLKASWNLNFSNTIRNTKGQYSSSGQLSDKGGINLKIEGGSYNATIYNNQPYSQRVEYGWSEQAPQGMMRVTVAEYTSISDSYAGRYRIK